MKLPYSNSIYNRLKGETIKPKLFVASSVESLRVPFAVQGNLDHDAEVTAWNQGVLRLSRSAIESLVQSLEKFDFAVFIFCPDDITMIRRSESSAVRDNVVFELGLFIGCLGRERCFIIVPNNVDDLRIPTDLLGITFATFDSNRADADSRAALGRACNEIRLEIEHQGSRKNEISTIISKDQALALTSIYLDLMKRELTWEIKDYCMNKLGKNLDSAWPNSYIAYK